MNQYAPSVYFVHSAIYDCCLYLLQVHYIHKANVLMLTARLCSDWVDDPADLSLEWGSCCKAQDHEVLKENSSFSPL